jgi:hypothetical protein
MIRERFCSHCDAVCDLLVQVFTAPDTVKLVRIESVVMFARFSSTNPLSVCARAGRHTQPLN